MNRRLFVGLEPPPDARAALFALSGGLRGARRVEPANLHLTLRFAGELDYRLANDLALELGGLRAAGFELRLAGANTFGSGRRPRMLWAGVAPSPPLRALKRAVDAAAARAGLGPDERKFTPHVTLARGVAPGAAERRAAEIAAAVAGAFPVREAVLFESLPGVDGRLYEAAARYPLDPP